MASFEIAYNITKGHEGVYSNDAKDLGGETAYGIARNFNKGWKGWPVIDKLKLAQQNLKIQIQQDPLILQYAKELYKAEYWDVLSLDNVKSQPIANEAFDSAVNLGVGRVALWIQEVLNVLNNGGAYYPDLKPDGNIGKVTIAALNSHPKPINILKSLNALQGAHYIQRAKDNPTQEKFLNGWMSRVFEYDNV